MALGDNTYEPLCCCCKLPMLDRVKCAGCLEFCCEDCRRIAGEDTSDVICDECAKVEAECDRT